jgi:tetratricopeptide (TPR) repeat protein
MQRLLIGLTAGVAVTVVVSCGGAFAATSEPTGEQINSAPCIAALTAGDDDAIIATCAALIGNDKAPKPERIRAAIARGAAFERKGDIDHAIADDDVALRLDPKLVDVLTARGALYRKKGDRVHALSDFGNAFKIDPNNVGAKANYKALSLEIERIGALMAVNKRPSFNCTTTKRPVEKAICASPALVTLDREINAVNTRVVSEAGAKDPRASRALQREQDDFVARRDAEFGQPGYDLSKVMRDRLDHLLALLPQPS